MTLFRVFVSFTALLIATQVSAGENWSNWRGPRLNGSTDAKGLPTTWGEDKNIRWKTLLPSWAGSSPVIWGDRIFLTTPGAKEIKGEGIARRLRRLQMEGPGGDSLLLLCISRKDGEVLWEKPLDKVNKLYGKHNMASPSPVTDGRHVWTLTGTGRLAAFTVDGEKVWERDIQKDYGEFGLYWGYASSPALADDKLIVQVLHGATTQNPSYLAAFDKKTGKTVWKVERKTDATQECPDAYTTPLITRVDGRDLIIISGADYVTAHDLADGSEIWRCGGLNPEKAGNYRICGTPIITDGLVIATSRERPMLAIRAGGKGDVSASNIAWRYDEKKAPDVPSVACDGMYLYLLHDDGFITCLEAKSGETVWGPERITGGPYSASPLVGDGRVYVTNEDCTTTVLAAGPKFKVMETNKLPGGYTLSSLAVADGELFLRSQKFLYCISTKGESD